MELRLAFWVSLGIPISFQGAVALMPGLDGSVNVLSRFGFVLVLGIVVVDAILVGENITGTGRRTGRASTSGTLRGRRNQGEQVVKTVLVSLVVSGVVATGSPASGQVAAGALAVDERQGDQYGWAVEPPGGLPEAVANDVQIASTRADRRSCSRRSSRAPSPRRGYGRRARISRSRRAKAVKPATVSARAAVTIRRRIRMSSVTVMFLG